MSRFFYFSLGVAIVVVLALVTGCASGGLLTMNDDWCAAHPDASSARCMAPSQSWDQENLKRHDVGCPSAIYIAPNGVLEQCEP
jgi:hypothetical protein